MKKIDSINLIPTAKLGFDQQNLAKKLKKFAFLTLGIFVLVFVVFFGYRFWLDQKKATLVSQKEGLTQSLAQFSPQLELLHRLRFRLRIVSDLLDSRLSSNEEVYEVLSFLPDGALIERINFQRGTIEIRGSLDSIIMLKDLEDRLAEVRKEMTYRKIELSSLRKTEEGWPFNLSLNKK